MFPAGQGDLCWWPSEGCDGGGGRKNATGASTLPGLGNGFPMISLYIYIYVIIYDLYYATRIYIYIYINISYLNTKKKYIYIHIWDYKIYEYIYIYIYLGMYISILISDVICNQCFWMKLDQVLKLMTENLAPGKFFNPCKEASKLNHLVTQISAIRRRRNVS